MVAYRSWQIVSPLNCVWRGRREKDSPLRSLRWVPIIQPQGTTHTALPQIPLGSPFSKASQRMALADTVPACLPRAWSSFPGSGLSHHQLQQSGAC